jgi:hypothetical protein
MGIQVTSKVDEDIKPLIQELVTKGFRYERSRIPLTFPNKDNTTTCNFYRDGVDVFASKTIYEVREFINDSSPILKSYDSTFDDTKCYLYDNEN